MKKIIIAKPGGSITDARKNLLFHSDDNTLKINIDRQDTISGGSTLNVAHGLSYIPMFMAFAKEPLVDGDNWYSVAGYGGGSRPIGLNGSVDGTNIVLENQDALDIYVRTFGIIDRIS